MTADTHLENLVVADLQHAQLSLGIGFCQPLDLVQHLLHRAVPGQADSVLADQLTLGIVPPNLQHQSAALPSRGVANHQLAHGAGPHLLQRGYCAQRRRWQCAQLWQQSTAESCYKHSQLHT